MSNEGGMASGNGNNGNGTKVDSCWTFLAYVGNKWGFNAVLLCVFILALWLLVGKPYAEDREQIAKDRAMLFQEVQSNLVRSTVAQELTSNAMQKISTVIESLKHQDDSFVANVNIQHTEQLKLISETLASMKSAHETMAPAVEERKLQTKLLTEIRDAVQENTP